jgi:PAS domain S-box-containing protein
MNNRVLFVGKNEQLFNWLGHSGLKLELFKMESSDSLQDSLSQYEIGLLVIEVLDNFLEIINVIEALKSDDENQELVVVVIESSSFSIPNNIRLAFQAGADEYLKTGISEVEFISRVEKLLKINRKTKALIEDRAASLEALGLMDKVSLFLDKADNSFVVMDEHGEIEWVNEGFERMYGFSKDEFKKSFGGNIFDASKNSNIKSKVERCVQQKRSVNYVAECRTKKGEYKWIQTTFTPIVAMSGKIESFIAIETDITKLKETEEALNQKNEYMLALTNHLQSANKLLEQQQKEINDQNQALAEEKAKSENLLLNILPYEVARQLKSKGEAKPRMYKLTSVMFLDFAGFTNITKELKPSSLVERLDGYFKQFDDIIEKHFIEKIKTIGDAYMCVGGLPLRNRSNPFNVVLAALEIQQLVKAMVEETKTPEGQAWRCRIGIHSGAVIAGVVGKKKYFYDIWGNTVNIASRIQDEGMVERVNISGETYQYIKEYFECEYRGMIAVKNADKQEMYFVNRLKQEYSNDEIGIEPNDEFIKMLNSL